MIIGHNSYTIEASRKAKKDSMIEKFIPYETLSKKGSDTTAAGGGYREGSEWQRSARCKSASSDAASAGHRNREK